MSTLYESIDHSPVALQDIRKAYHEAADLVDGIKNRRLWQPIRTITADALRP